MVLLPILAFHPTLDFQTHYGDDYQAAIAFCKENKALILEKATAHQCDAASLTAIAFPELIRYNAFQNLFETAALELGYVNGGKSIADFSIGSFQMKPSFVETMEKLVENAAQNSWASDFQHLCEFDAGNESDIRKQRIKRLKNKDWQMEYLVCFYKYAETLTDNRFSSAEKIRHIATRYNCGATKSDRELAKWLHRKSFPYGPTYPTENQHCYADIAVDFYKNVAAQLFHP